MKMREQRVKLRRNKVRKERDDRGPIKLHLPHPTADAGTPAGRVGVKK